MEDFSIYHDQIPKTCSRLEITSPGFTSPAVIDVIPGFQANLHSCLLGLQSIGCEDGTSPLPDGIYKIRYSLAPNDKLFVEYDHLRITDTMSKYYLALCELELVSSTPSIDLKASIRELQMIRGYLDAAKGKVEYEHSPIKGMDLFLYADKLLRKFKVCTTSCNNY